CAPRCSPPSRCSTATAHLCRAASRRAVAATPRKALVRRRRDGWMRPVMTSVDDERVTAAVLIIGDEILSGRTQDTNLRDIARYLAVLGIDLAEARTVPDVLQ